MPAVAQRRVDKYLRCHAQPEAALGAAIERTFAHVVVIPARAEAMDLLDGIRPAATAGAPVLCILVVNGDDDDDAAVHDANAALLGTLRADLARVRRLGDRAWLGEVGPLCVLVVDRASAGARLPVGEGVGLARRIGCDLALALWAAGRVASPWLHTTDADVTLPTDTFARAQAAPPAAALVYPFVHDRPADPARARALALYEIYLRYYVAGLRFAGSPYAFHTIGSTLAVHGAAYAAVRGVPRRLAGEDFYLLSKLAKVGVVDSLGGAPIRIAGRDSDRVPFGTGAAVTRIAAQLARGEPFLLHDPRAFVLLAAWLAAVEAHLAGGSAVHAHLADRLDGDGRAILGRAITQVGADRQLVDASGRATAPAAVRRRVHGWLDGLRTLKLIHALRDAGLPDVPWQEALAAGFVQPGATLETGVEATAIARLAAAASA
jgi:hypothetical protein